MRDNSALEGQAAAAAQLPISLLMLSIPGYTTTIDVWGEAPVVSHTGGYAPGSTSIHVAGLGSGTIPVAARFSINGVWYTTTRSTTITGGEATIISFTPGLIGSVADGAAILTLAFYITDYDDVVYLNTDTNEVSMEPGAGLIPFVPYAGMSVPQIQLSESQALAEVSLTLSNIRGDWSAVVAQNQYRETPAALWQGNLSIDPDAPPQSASFVGVLPIWIGRLVYVNPKKPKASLQLSPHVTPWTLSFPYRTYSTADFIHMPTPNFTINFGFTERELS